MAVFEALYEHALQSSSQAAIELLKSALSSVEGEPFAGSNYEWAALECYEPRARHLIEA